MMKALDHIQGWAPSVAATICILLSGWIWIPQEHGLDNLTVRATSQQQTQTEDVTDAALQRGAQQLLERPLFHTSRRPPAEVEQVQTAPVNVTLALTGVLDSDNIQIALLRLSNSPELHRKRIGDKIGEWTILEITKTTVSVRDGNGQEQLIGLSSASP